MSVPALESALTEKLGPLVDGSSFELVDEGENRFAIYGSRRLCRIFDIEGSGHYEITGMAVEVNTVATSIEQAVTYLSEVVLEGQRTGFSKKDPSQA